MVQRLTAERHPCAERSVGRILAVSACQGHSEFGIRTHCVPGCASRARTPRGPPTSFVEERKVRIKRTTPRSGISRRTRLIAVSTGLVAAAAFAVPSAHASDTPSPFSADEVKSPSTSVLKAVFPGTAWAVDSKTSRVLVTVDSTVSQAEIAKIKQQAG